MKADCMDVVGMVTWDEHRLALRMMNGGSVPQARYETYGGTASSNGRGSLRRWRWLLSPRDCHSVNRFW